MGQNLWFVCDGTLLLLIWTDMTSPRVSFDR